MTMEPKIIKGAQAGRFGLARMPDMALDKVMVGQGVGSSPVEVDRYTAAWANINEKSLVNLLNNADFEAGDPSGQWTALSATIALETTTVKWGNRAMKITANGANGRCPYFATLSLTRYPGRKMTFGAWVNAPVANDKPQQLSMSDDAGDIFSDVIPKDDAWHWVTVTRTITATPTWIKPHFWVNHSGTADTDDILYVKGAICVEGDSCPAFSPKPDQSLICHHTADYTMSEYETGHVVHTNLGAGGDITITLPQTVAAGFVCHFAVMAAHQLRIDPGVAGAIYINGAKQTDNKYIWADDEAESVTLVADGNGDWVAMYTVGTWGVEP